MFAPFSISAGISGPSQRTSVSPIQRERVGRNVGTSYLDALRGALERAGAVLLEEAAADETGPERGVKVPLKRAADMPEETGRPIGTSGP